MRWLFGCLVLAAMVLVAAPALAHPPSPDPNAVQPPPGTVGGAVSDTDRVLLEKVRQAGLWEIPTGQQAQQRASSEKVKEVGRHLATDHVFLDDETRKIAERLNVVLPSQATADQQRWMRELSSKSGTEYDLAFAQLLRAAHGAVFSIAASVRAGTRNDVVRAFAATAVTFVHKHMVLLESTGLVDYGQLPEPVVTPTKRNGGPLTYVVLLAVAGALAVGGIFRVVRGT